MEIGTIIGDNAYSVQYIADAATNNIFCTDYLTNSYPGILIMQLLNDTV
jgi:hypothetical protein